jgi:hypothetical protein
VAWAWIRIGDDVMLGFTYDDPTAGPSAKGAFVHSDSFDDDVRRAVERPDHTVRLGHGVYTAVPLETELTARFELPGEPEWMTFFRPSSDASRPWRNDPALVGRFHASFPDDLEVRFYLFAAGAVETMWVQTNAVDEEIGGYAGVLLNQPHAARAEVDEGARVSYRSARGAPEPLWVSPATRANLHDWSSECTACGFDMVLEPIEDIVGPHVAASADMPHQILGMCCPMCEGAMTVERRRRR